MSRYTNTVPQILDGDGKPIVGAKKFFFEPGGSKTPKTIYSDSGLTIPADNPQRSDSNGRYIDDIFLDGIYEEEQQDNSGTPTGYDGNTLWTKDPVGDTGGDQFDIWVNDNTYDKHDIVLASNGEHYESIVNLNQGNDPSLGNPDEWVLYGGAVTTTGTADAYEAKFGIDEYVINQLYYVNFHVANNQDPTINLDSQGALDLVLRDGSQINAGILNGVHAVVYDGVNAVVYTGLDGVIGTASSGTGSCIKMADGTMMCFAQDTATVTASSNGSVNITFAEPFIDSNYIAVSSVITLVGAGLFSEYRHTGKTASSLIIWASDNDNNPQTGSLTMSCYAIGRWKA